MNAGDSMKCGALGVRAAAAVSLETVTSGPLERHSRCRQGAEVDHWFVVDDHSHGLTRQAAATGAVCLLRRSLSGRTLITTVGSNASTLIEESHVILAKRPTAGSYAQTRPVPGSPTCPERARPFGRGQFSY